jgi:hypothetical protein
MLGVLDVLGVLGVLGVLDILDVLDVLDVLAPPSGNTDPRPLGCTVVRSERTLGHIFVDH